MPNLAALRAAVFQPSVKKNDGGTYVPPGRVRDNTKNISFFTNSEKLGSINHIVFILTSGTDSPSVFAVFDDAMIQRPVRLEPVRLRSEEYGCTAPCICRHNEVSVVKYLVSIDTSRHITVKAQHTGGIRTKKKNVLALRPSDREIAQGA